MKLHWGKTGLGHLRFATDTFSYLVDGQRQLFQSWIKHRIKAAYGVSFGHSRFIGVMQFSDTQHERERIK